MKKNILTMMLFAVAAIASVSCQKEAQNAPAQPVTLTFTSANPETKTEWNEDNQTIWWSDKDAIRVALKIGETWYADGSGAKLYQSSSLSGSSPTATFTIKGFTQEKITEENWDGDYQFYALYPDSVEDANFAQSSSLATLNIKSEQNLSSKSFDKSADILWGKAGSVYNALPESEDVHLEWTRIVAHAYITLKDINGMTAGEKVTSVTLKAQDGAEVTGTYKLHMAEGTLTASSPSNTVKLSCAGVEMVENGSLTFWACINPCTITSLDITVETDVATYTCSKSGFSREFLQNKRNILPVDMSGATRTEKEVEEVTGYYVKVTEAPADGDWSGQYLIVCEDKNVTMTGSATTGDGIKKHTAVVIDNERIKQTDAMDAVSVTIDVHWTQEDGYYIKTASNYFIYATATGAFSASASESTGKKYYYSFDFSNSELIIASTIVDGGATKYMRCYGDNFGHYSKMDQYYAVQLYKLQN